MSGKGVAGLRSAVFEAGAETLVATLWEIPDEFTVQFMKSFYGSILNGNSPSESMWSTRKDYFQRLKKDASLAEAVFAVAPFFAVTNATR